LRSIECFTFRFTYLVAVFRFVYSVQCWVTVTTVDCLRVCKTKDCLAADNDTSLCMPAMFDMLSDHFCNTSEKVFRVPLFPVACIVRGNWPLVDMAHYSTSLAINDKCFTALMQRSSRPVAAYRCCTANAPRTVKSSSGFIVNFKTSTNVTRSQAVARIADRTASGSQQTIYYYYYLLAIVAK